jgi:hypothetical protein
VPEGSTLTFTYVFGSEEYNEFVKAGFNDVFAFFLNGSNVALLPGTSTPVGIDTINRNTNPQFYSNNADQTDPFPATPPLLNTQLDGLSKVLTVTAPVNPGVVNHIKLAIADRRRSPARRTPAPRWCASRWPASGWCPSP